MKRISSIKTGIHGFPVSITLNLDGDGRYNISTGIGFFDHLLQLLSRHSGFDLEIKCEADLYVDDHHLVDEIGMILGLAFKNALHQADTSNINRYGYFILPMDETLLTCAIDLCGRSSFVFDIHFSRENIGEMSTEMIREFWNLFSQKAEINFIAKSEFGINDHHIAEGLFKCVGKSLNVSIQNKVK